MFGKREKEERDEEKQKQAQRFYLLLQSLMNEIFEYASKSKHVALPYNTFFGLVYDNRDSVLFSGLDRKTGKKVYLYNLRIIAKTFELRRNQMIADQTTDSLFNWIYEVCSLYIDPFVYEFVVNVQHRGKGAAERTTRQIVKGFLNKLLSDPDLKYVLDTIKQDDPFGDNNKSKMLDE